jgi:hypothetical protein
MKIKVLKKGSSKIKKNLDCPMMVDDPSLPQR